MNYPHFQIQEKPIINGPRLAFGLIALGFVLLLSGVTVLKVLGGVLILGALALPILSGRMGASQEHQIFHREVQGPRTVPTTRDSQEAPSQHEESLAISSVANMESQVAEGDQQSATPQVPILEGLTVLELNTLVKDLEEKWGISATAPAAVGFAGGDGPTAAVEVEEETEFDVELTEVGANKIQVIKAVRELTDLVLKEANNLPDSDPSAIEDDAANAKLEEASNESSSEQRRAIQDWQRARNEVLSLGENLYRHEDQMHTESILRSQTALLIKALRNLHPEPYRSSLDAQNQALTDLYVAMSNDPYAFNLTHEEVESIIAYLGNVDSGTTVDIQMELARQRRP